MTNSNADLDLDENVRAALTYLLGWLTGIVFLLIEKKSDFVRFHALQSTITFLGLHVIMIVLGGTFMFGFSAFGVIVQLISILGLILWIVLMIKAYQGEKFKLPIVGDIAESHAYR